MTDKTKKIIKITALGLCAAVLTVAVLAFLAFPRTSRAGMQLETPSNLGGMTVEETDGDGVSLAAVEIPPENFADYGIMPIAEKAYTLTATVNEDATVKAVDWTIEFQNPASEWATGKTVTDYVSFSSKGDLTATVACSQAFGEPIIVSAVSKDDPAVKATCKCDYQKQIIGVDLEMNSIEGTDAYHNISTNASIGSNLGKIFFNENLYGYSIKPRFNNIGTIQPNAIFDSMTLSIPDEAITELAKEGFTLTTSAQNGIITNWEKKSIRFGEETLLALFGSDAASNRSTLVKALKALNGRYSNLIRATISFMNGGGSYKSEAFDFYFDVDADSLLKPVTSVELDQENLLF